MNSVMLPNVLSYVYINRSQAASMTHVRIVTVTYDSTTTSGKMVTQQQDRLDLRGAGELRMGPHQLEETGRLGIATPLLPNKSKFLFDQYGPLLALIYFHETQSLLFDSCLLLMTQLVTS